MIDYAALKSEITNDPAALGYAGLGDNQIAALINAVSQTIDIDRTLIDAYEIVNATAPAEFTALSSAEKTRYQIITGAGMVDASNANIRNAFTTMFAGGTATRTALTALLTRKGSRAEQLFGAGITVSDQDIAKARVS